MGKAKVPLGMYSTNRKVAKASGVDVKMIEKYDKNFFKPKKKGKRLLIG